MALEKAESTEARMTDEERVEMIHGKGFLTVGSWVGIMDEIPRLGIPSLKLQDSGNGFRPTAPGEMGATTSWPSSLTLAASWDENVVRTTARAIAHEFKQKGANVILGPGVNVHRTAFGGRNFEYLSGEDPYLGGRLAAAYVEAVQREGVMAVVKHFAFNEQETNRGIEDSLASDRTKWELYYPPFEAAINAGAGSVMCAYNKVGGAWACGSQELLRDDLKRTMRFSGFVMSDWQATHATNYIEKGLDMEQPRGKFFTPESLKKENVSRAAIREASRRILAAIYHMRFDENPGCGLHCEKDRRTVTRTAESLRIAREGAIAGTVLLKNDGVLPLRTNAIRRLAVLGPAASAKDTLNTWGPGSPYSGGGSGHVAAPHVITPLQGIKERAHKAGIVVLDDDSDVYEDTAGKAMDASAELNLNIFAAPSPQQRRTPRGSSASARGIADKADVVIIVAAATTTESIDRVSLTLDDGADDLIQSLVGRKPTVVLLQVPGALVMPWRDKASAIACMFYGGEETGRAWASVIFGDSQPTGKLPIMMPLSEHDAIKPGTQQVVYEEGLLTSYRSSKLKAAFAFGFGLTYTRFSISMPFQVKNCQEAACIEATVLNEGIRPGSEVLQVYFVFDPNLEGPLKTLRGFHRTRVLQPGHREIVRMKFTDRDCSTYKPGKGWTQEEWIVAQIGTSSLDVQHLLPIRTSMPIRMLH